MTRDDWSPETDVPDLEYDPYAEEDEQPTRVDRVLYVAATVWFVVTYVPRTAWSAIGVFIDNWLVSRPGGLILWGLPAVVVLVTAGFLVLALRPGRSGELITRYRTEAQKAADAGDMAAAALWLEKTLQLNPLDPQHRFGLALTALNKGQTERALEMIDAIAPDAGTGYPPAHLWKAKHLIAAEQPLSAETAGRVEHHLLQAVEDTVERQEAQAMLGELYFGQRKMQQAVEQLEKAAPQRPALSFKLAQALMALGRAPEAQLPAAKARDYFRRQSEEDPQLIEARQGWAFSEQLLGNHQEAVRILETGLAAADSEVLHQSLVDVYINWHNQQVLGGQANLAWQLELLSRALQHGPEDPRLLTQLAKLSIRDFEQSDQAYALLKELVARGVAPAMVHLIIGTRALKQGNYDEAREHLLLARDRDLQTPILLNNLAWMLAHQQQPDLEQALELAEAARQLSDRPEIADTIGTILARMGRTREAIGQLETALRGLPGTREIHAKLADCYQQLGDRKLAQIHRELAGEQPAADAP
jgi:tetratricopeptide (TPR) repeat protein